MLKKDRLFQIEVQTDNVERDRTRNEREKKKRLTNKKIVPSKEGKQKDEILRRVNLEPAVKKKKKKREKNK